MHLKIFAVKDENDPSRKTLSWLIYYPHTKTFYLEVPNEIDTWEAPLLVSSFVSRGERTLNAHWSKLWVQQRIIPQDRQNLGLILKENGLQEYDEFSLLMLAKGRCAQDDYFLEALHDAALPEELSARFQRKVEEVLPLADQSLLVFFKDGLAKCCHLRAYLSCRQAFAPIRSSTTLFRSAEILPGGYGVGWGEAQTISVTELYQMGEPLPIQLEDLRQFVSRRVLTTAESAHLLDCSRQSIDARVRSDQLHPVKTTPKAMLFLKGAVAQQLWK